jgi:hypothetical protein
MDRARHRCDDRVMSPRQIAMVALATAAACGSKARVPHDPTTTDPTAQVVAVGGGLTPELIATVGSRPLVIEAFSTLRLSAAERLRAQQLIADWATATGLKILSPEDVERAIGRAAAGLDPTTNQACGPALDREYAMERWILPMGAEGSITARVDCEASCTLQLQIKLFGLGTEFFAAPFDPSQPWEQELVRRLPTAVDNGGHGRHGHLNNPVQVSGVPREAGTNDWYFEDNAFTDGRAVAEVASCGATDRLIVLMLEGADDGTLSCEPAATPGYVTEYDAKVNSCACAAAVKLEQPTAPRSYVVYPALPPAERVRTKNGKEISAMLIGGNEYRPRGTAAWMLRESDSIAHCFVDRTAEVAAAEVGATLEFDQTGRVAKATIGDLSGMLQLEERACVTTKLMAITSPCPAGTPLPGYVRVTLEVSAP